MHKQSWTGFCNGKNCHERQDWDIGQNWNVDCKSDESTGPNVKFSEVNNPIEGFLFLRR